MPPEADQCEREVLIELDPEEEPIEETQENNSESTITNKRGTRELEKAIEIFKDEGNAPYFPCVSGGVVP